MLRAMLGMDAARSTGSPVLLFSAMIALAGLDFLGSVLAKEWTASRSHWLFAAGLLTFAVLFCVYAVSLEMAELSTVTFGWIIFLQVGLLLFERIRYGVELPTGKWVAIPVILGLQAYLVLAPNGRA
jgi:hypothetical protein